MKRAAVIIGVDKTGDLPRLNDAARGAQLVETWAHEQKMDPVHLFVDTKDPVEIGAIKKAIAKMVNDRNVSQLVIYFAGHGFNKQRNEYWLLSDAPVDTQAAVNVAGSVALAATCGIPHIVLISDACRTAAEGLRAQSVTGSEIFPNLEDDEKPIDQFFACQLGRPSYEIKDAAISTAEYKALYTNELVPTLRGQRPKVVEWTTEGAEKVGLIHPRPLRDFMSSAIAAKLEGSHLQTSTIQVPTAQISSDPPAWISRLGTQAPGSTAPPPLPPIEPIPISPITAAKTAAFLLSSRLVPNAPLPPEFRSAFARGLGLPEDASEIFDSVGAILEPFGPTHHETKCGFKIRGARIVRMHAKNAELEFALDNGPPGYDIRVDKVERPGVSVLLVLEDGSGIMLPAIPGFIAALTVEDGEMVNIAYEPSSNTDRWDEYQRKAQEIRELRAIVSASLTRGVFRLERDDALEISRRMQDTKSIDPSLAIYAAYGYHDLQRRNLIREMLRFMGDDLGAVLFDVAMLSRALDNQEIRVRKYLLSPMPLLSQGWALLSAFGVKLSPRIRNLQDRLLPSLWTMFDQLGVELARDAIDSGEIR
jgi:hypothetical protein